MAGVFPSDMITSPQCQYNQTNTYPTDAYGSAIQARVVSSGGIIALFSDPSRDPNECVAMLTAFASSAYPDFAFEQARSNYQCYWKPNYFEAPNCPAPWTPSQVAQQ